MALEKKVMIKYLSLLKTKEIFPYGANKKTSAPYKVCAKVKHGGSKHVKTKFNNIIKTAISYLLVNTGIR